MILTPYELTLIAGGFTVVGALIAVFAGHFLAKQLSSYSYRLSKLDEIRSSIISLYSGVYPVVSEWPTEIKIFLKEKNPELSVLIQQCKPHLNKGEFEKLAIARDSLLTDIEGYINRQNDTAELHYGSANPKKGQVRLRNNIDNILEYIK